MDFKIVKTFCPYCGKEHDCELHDGYEDTTLHGVSIRYRIQFYRCSELVKIGWVDETDWMTGEQHDQNLKNAKQAYQNKIESQE